MNAGTDYQVVAGPLASLVLLTLLVALPMKIGAKLVHAKYTGLIRCGFAAFVGLLGALLVSVFLGGLIGPFLACALGYLLAIRAMLGTTFLGAIGLTVIAMLVAAAGGWLLSQLGMVLLAPHPAGVAI